MESDVPSMTIRTSARRATRLCAIVVVVCILLTATGCFVMIFRPGRDILSWRMLRSVAVFAALISATIIPAFITFFHFERAKRWIVGAGGIEIHDPNYGVEYAAWSDIVEVQVREHGVTLVISPTDDYAPLNRMSTYRNRTITFVDPDQAQALVRLHLSLTGS